MTPRVYFWLCIHFALTLSLIENKIKLSIEADCWMAGQCWMTMSPNNIRLEVKTLISFIGCHPTILVYKLKYWIHFRCCHPAISTCKNLPLYMKHDKFFIKQIKQPTPPHHPISYIFLGHNEIIRNSSKLQFQFQIMRKEIVTDENRTSSETSHLNKLATTYC